MVVVERTIVVGGWGRVERRLGMLEKRILYK